MKKPVMVIGGGIAGIQATHDLAEMGVPVFLVEESPTIGGRMAQLDKTFPTNDCSACILAPKMTACFNHSLVKTLTYSEVMEIRGNAPDFTAVVKLKPRYVNVDKCTGCGACYLKCPVKVKSEFDMQTGIRKAIYKPFAQAIPNKAVLDMNSCVMCRICEKVCAAKAIDYNQKEEIVEIEVSAVIMSAGYDTADRLPGDFFYHANKDVVTSLEYERIMSANGPYEGHIKRPSDNVTPKRIAFIQCVGSRDSQCNRDYCSSICCMQAVKQAIITKEHMPDIEEISIFYMDMRAVGKDFDNYLQAAKNRYGIGFVRSRVSSVKEENGGLILSYADETGSGAKKSYDMVVLSVGLMPSPSSLELLKNAGVKTDKYGFTWAHEYDGAVTNREGFFVCGVLAAPKDIPETVIEASAAATAVYNTAKLREVDLYSDYSRYFKKESLPVMRDAAKEPIRIGVFVCNCGVNIGAYADVGDITEYAKTLPFVVHTEPFMYACAIDAQQLIADCINEHKLNRIVVAACTPRTHEPLFHDVMAKAGLNPYLMTMANIRDQCTWVHMDDKAAATHKAKELVRMAVGKVTFAKQLSRKTIGVNKSALVIGGGISGMTAALELADMGYKVHIAESSERLGGNAVKLGYSNLGRPVSPYVKMMIDKAQSHSNISIYFNAKVKDIAGYVGNFTANIKTADDLFEIEMGAIIVAVGANEHKPKEYLYGEDSRVITQMDLEAESAKNFAALKDVKRLVMIQCVGSREFCSEGGRAYCSRVCCSQAVKNSLLLKKKYPNLDITILYRDIRTYGMNELMYREARQAGVSFILYEEADKPVVQSQNGHLSVQVYEPIINACTIIDCDCLVLSTAIIPNKDNIGLGQILKVPTNQDGFFLEAHVKLRPVDFATEGIYICGLAHAPKNMKESIIQGKAAAGRAATIISKDKLETEGAIASSTVISYCAACGDCEKVCAYNAVQVAEVLYKGKMVRRAVVNEVLCKGCGTCTAVCRPGAIDMNGFSDKQILTEIEYLLRKAN